MRVIAYAVAVIAAAGIVLFLSRPGDSKNASTGSANQASVAKSVPVKPVAGASQVVLHVPGMHCPFGCYPAVKETLTSQPGVTGVELAKQSDENAIDNPHVTVTYSGNFNADAAIAALAKAGFEKSTVE